MKLILLYMLSKNMVDDKCLSYASIKYSIDHSLKICNLNNYKYWLMSHR